MVSAQLESKKEVQRQSDFAGERDYNHKTDIQCESFQHGGKDKSGNERGAGERAAELTSRSKGYMVKGRSRVGSVAHGEVLVRAKLPSWSTKNPAVQNLREVVEVVLALAAVAIGRVCA